MEIPTQLKPGYIWTNDLARTQNLDQEKCPLKRGGFVCRYYKGEATPKYNDCRDDLVQLEKGYFDSTRRSTRRLQDRWLMFLRACRDQIFDKPYDSEMWRNYLFCPMVPEGTTLMGLFCACVITWAGDTFFDLEVFFNPVREDEDDPENILAALSRNDLDILADWYERASAAARSINQRQDDGRGGCNGAKMAELREFFLSNREEKIEGLVSSGCKYAAYLNERTQQILQMERSKEWAKVEKIDCLRGKYL